MPKATPCFRPEHVRTFTLAGHRSSGKTSLGEVLLQQARVTRTVGRVDDGTSLLDHDPDERRHRQTLQLSTAWMDWQEHRLHLIDTPGAEAASTDRALGIAAADGLVITVDAVAGLEIGTEGALQHAAELRLPLLVAITKLDRLEDVEGLAAVVRRLEDASGRRCVSLHLPFYDDHGALAGLVCVLSRRVLRYAADGSGACSPEPLPEALRAEVDRATERIAEAVALTDDGLLEQYLEDLELPDDRVREGLARAASTGELVPVVLTSAARGIGAVPLLDAIVELLPSPVARPAVHARVWDGAPVHVGTDGPLVAQLVSTQRDTEGNPWHLLRVWRGTPARSDWVHGHTSESARIHKLYAMRGPRRKLARQVGPGSLIATWEPLPGRPGDTFTQGEPLEVELPTLEPPMMAWWIRTPDPALDRELADALRELVRCDRGLALHTDDVTGALLLAAASEVHLSVAVERLRHRLGIPVTHALPPVAYRETPAAPIEGVCGTHVRSGEHGLVSEFGQCEVGLAPTSPETVSFVDLVADDDDLPPRYRPAIDAGAREAMRRGPTAGYPVVGVELRLTGGKYDILQSTDDHFRLAGAKATREALSRTGTRLLEPWWEVEVHAPQVSLGDLISDISAHRGRIVGMEVDGATAQLRAHCPYRELRTFPIRLQGLTGGRGRLSWRESHYEPLPSHLVQEAIDDSPFR